MNLNSYIKEEIVEFTVVATTRKNRPSRPMEAQRFKINFLLKIEDGIHNKHFQHEYSNMDIIISIHFKEVSNVLLDL